MVKENNFKIHATQIVQNNKRLGGSFIYDHKATYNRREQTIDIFVAGEALPDEMKERIYRDAEHFGITRGQIIIHEDATIVREDLSEAEILKGIYEHTDRQIKELNDSITRLNLQLDVYKNKEIPSHSIAKELFAQHPEISNISLTRGSAVDADSLYVKECIMVFINCDYPIDQDVRARIENWLKVRLDNENVTVVY